MTDYKHLFELPIDHKGDGWCTLIAYSQCIAALKDGDPTEIFRALHTKLESCNYQIPTQYGEVQLMDNKGVFYNDNLFSANGVGILALEWLLDGFDIDFSLEEHLNKSLIYAMLQNKNVALEIGVQFSQDGKLHNELHSIVLANYNGNLVLHDSNIEDPVEFDSVDLFWSYFHPEDCPFYYTFLTRGVLFRIPN